jgi:hypothetical protein
VKKSKYCPKCKKWYAASTSFYANRSRRDGLATYCKSCHNEVSIAEAQSVRLRAIEHLGGVCLHCGYSANVQALTFDHINGDGYLERKLGIRPSNARLSQQILDGRDDIQLLCCNCNQIKKVANEEMGDRLRASVEPDPEHDPAPPPNGQWKTIDGRWSRHLDYCVDCGRDDRKHAGFGYCGTCYVRKNNREKVQALKRAKRTP